MLERLVGAVAVAHAPLGGKRPVPAILDAAWPWLSDEPCRASAPRRDRARAVGGHRASCHPCRNRGSRARAQRARRNPPRHACGAVSAGACHPLQRRADRRLSRRERRAGFRADEPALLRVAQYRAEHARRDRPPYPLGLAPPGRWRPPRGADGSSPRSSERGHPGPLCRSHRHGRPSGSPPPSTAGSMQGTAPASTRGSRSSTGFRKQAAPLS